MEPCCSLILGSCSGVCCLLLLGSSTGVFLFFASSSSYKMKWIDLSSSVEKYFFVLQKFFNMCLKSGKCVSENIHLYNVLPKSFLFFCFSCKVSLAGEFLNHHHLMTTLLFQEVYLVYLGLYLFAVLNPLFWVLDYSLLLLLSSFFPEL